MSKFELLKTIEARKLNKRTGRPTVEPSVTIPCGAIIDNLAEHQDVINFSYLGEPYQGPAEVVSIAATPLQPLKTEPAASDAPRQEPSPAVIAEPALDWQEVKSSQRQKVMRARVPGGWLVSVDRAGVAFYPDPEHRW